MKDCTLLVNSYDGGEDLWEGFFKAWSVQWAGFDMPVVLNTESKNYSYPGFNIKTFKLYQGKKNVPWAKRLIETLKRIDTDYILFFLDDFWLDAPVDVEFFEKTLEWLRKNPDVATISYQPTNGQNIQDGRFERFEKRPQKGEYRMNCQAAIWRREKLISFLRPHESAWDWERDGSIRSSRYKDCLYTLIDGSPLIFSYDLGGVIYKGRWCRSVIEPLVKELEISVDYTRRGFHEDWKNSNPKRKRNLWRGIKNRINRIRSII